MKKILVIDDESIICASLKMLLEDLSYQVLTAENGKEGIELYKTEDIDLIISDINMPEMNGFQVCEYVSKDNPEFPIIVLSGLGAVDQAMQAIKLGAWDFLNKPIKDFTILEHSISKAFEKSELLKENRKYKEFLESTVEKQSVELKIEKDFRKISDAKFKNLFENVNDAVLVLLDDIIIDCNNKTEEFFNLTRENILGNLFWEFFSEEQINNISIKDFKTYFEKAFLGESQIFEILKVKDSNKIYFELSVSKLEQDSGAYLLVILRDITKRKMIEERLRVLSSAVEQSPTMVLITDTEGKIEYVNNSFTKITGYSLEEIKGKKPSVLRSGKMSPEVYIEMWQTITSGQPWSGELNNKKKNGELYWEYSYINPIKNEMGEIVHFVAVKEDITLRKKYEAELIKQANYDSLTGLPNRILAMDRLSQAIEQSIRNNSTMLLMLVDIDRFKNINDSLGHIIGDELIRKVAHRMNSCVRKYDTVARLGGDEYLIIIPEVGDVKTNIIEKILNSFKQPFEIDGHQLYITVSIGVSVCPDDSVDPYVLLRNADAAMYKAKSEGRDRFWFYSSEMNEMATKMLDMEMELREALEKDEIYLNFQPKLNLKTGEIVGVETLMRWQNSKLGFVPPDEFITVAEHTGLIFELSEFMMKKACSQVKLWEKIYGKNISLAVNVSSKQFQVDNFVDSLMDILEEYEINPEIFEIEITESLLIQDVTKTTEMLDMISNKGISISIDDFGTGYSSLSYLKKFPVNKLKIDKSFIMNLSEDSDDYALVKAIISIGRSLGLGIIAEGVETKKQELLLKEIDCDQVQGYFYSKPLNEKDFIEFLKKNK